MDQPRRAQAGLGRSYQRTTIFPNFTVRENCRLSAQAKLQKPWDWLTPAVLRLIGIRGTERPATHWACIAGRRRGGDVVARAKRQLEIAMCLATAPQILLLDEPLAGMDSEETERMLELLNELKVSHAILLVEHDMDAVFRVRTASP